jgi:hypothetical protein
MRSVLVIEYGVVSILLVVVLAVDVPAARKSLRLLLLRLRIAVLRVWMMREV